LTEKLGRNDLCPCGSGRRFQTLLHGIRTLRRHQPRLLFSGSDEASAQHSKPLTVRLRPTPATRVRLKETNRQAHYALAGFSMCRAPRHRWATDCFESRQRKNKNSPSR
jgi:hypothetical protein